MARAVGHARRRAQRDDLALVWYTAALSRTKKMPALKEFAGDVNTDDRGAQPRQMGERLREAFAKVGVTS